MRAFIGLGGNQPGTGAAFVSAAAELAQIGQEFTIYRKGEIFRHPLTDKPLGHYEQVLGHAQVRRVQPRFSEAVFIPLPDKARPAPEDGARVTRGRIKVAITPVLADVLCRP